MSLRNLAIVGDDIAFKQLKLPSNLLHLEISCSTGEMQMASFFCRNRILLAEELQSLDLSGMKTISSYSFLSHIRSLVHLSIHSFTPVSIRTIPTLPNIRALELGHGEGEWSDALLSQLVEKFPQLEHLGLGKGSQWIHNTPPRVLCRLEQLISLQVCLRFNPHVSTDLGWLDELAVKGKLQFLICSYVNIPFDLICRIIRQYKVGLSKNSFIEPETIPGPATTPR